MKKEIEEKLNEIINIIQQNYNRIKIIDIFDGNEITHFYLNKNESFEKFEESFIKVYEKYDGDYLYTDIIDFFNEKNKNKFDYFEIEYLDINTDKSFEIEI